MSVNPSITQLDSGQIVKRVYDESNDAVRIEVAGGTSFAVALDNTDSIVALGTEDGTAGGTYHAIRVGSTGIVQTAITNASGGSAVNIQDGGNSITVDGSVTATVSATDLDIRNLTFASDKVDASGSVISATGLSADSGPLDSAATGVVDGPVSSSGIRSYQIYGIVLAEDVPLSGTTGDITAVLELSPLTSGTDFYTTSLTLTIPATSAPGVIVVSTLLTNLIGVRARLSLTANGLAGADSVKFVLVGSAF